MIASLLPLIVFSAGVLVAGSIYAFLGSDYAQRKWNPEGK